MYNFEINNNFNEMLLTNVGYIYIFLTILSHPFHVSVCEIYHNADTKSLEISMKIFIDDLELSIQKDSAENFKLIEVSPEEIDKKYIESYLIKRFKIKINGEIAELDFLGFEIDNDAILCYLEKMKVKKIELIEINNSIITEVYDDQINLTHFQYKDEMKSVKATKSNTISLIDTSGW